MRVKVVAQGNNESPWWVSNSRLRGNQRLRVRRDTYCATPPPSMLWKQYWVQNTKKHCTFRHLTCPFCVFYRVSICSVYQSRACHHVLATKAMFELTIRERLTSYHVCKTGKYWVLLIVFSLLTLCIPPYEENRTDKRMKGNTWSSRNIRVLVCFVRNCLYKTAAQTKLRSVPDIWDYIAIQLLLVMFKI